MQFDSKLGYKIRKLILQEHLYTNHGPRYEKYGLINHIRNLEYNLYDLVTAYGIEKSGRRGRILHTMNTVHEQIRLDFHLYYEIGGFHFRDGRSIRDDDPNFGDRRYGVISSMVDEIGRMIGSRLGLERVAAERIRAEMESLQKAGQAPAG